MHSKEIKTKEFALNQLLNLKGTHSKMDNLNYSELKLQNYLRDKKYQHMKQKNLFKFRVRVANFKENFKGKYTSTVQGVHYVVYKLTHRHTHYSVMK